MSDSDEDSTSRKCKKINLDKKNYKFEINEKFEKSKSPFKFKKQFDTERNISATKKIIKKKIAQDLQNHQKKYKILQILLQVKKKKQKKKNKMSELFF